MDSHVIPGSTFDPYDTIILNDFTSPESLLTVNNAAHADGPPRVSRWSPSPPRDRHSFEIAIICALPLEASTVSALFDRKWDGQIYGKAPGDPNVYSFGAIGHHNVVLAHMPNMGKVAAATAAVGLRTSFERINLALVVGICGGAPFSQSQDEILLGDVVISEGLIQYDLGRRFPNNRFARKDTPRDNLPRPSPEIRAALAKLKSEHNWLQDKISEYLDILQQRLGDGATYPGPTEDRLFKSAYQHKHHETSKCEICSDDDGQEDVCNRALNLSCEQLRCDKSELVSRPRLTQLLAASNGQRPAVHFGLIASGDTVMKSGKDRDDIAVRDGIIAFEMEGAGVWENLPSSLVIKGICDYADSHKSKRWQYYAAVTAAAATKAFLGIWSASHPERPSPHQAILYHQESSVRNVEIQQDPTRKARGIEILRKLYKSPYEDRKNRNPNRTQGTCEWFVAHKLFREWQESKLSTTLWISADPGCGKSVLAKHLIDSVLPSTASRTTCYFFFKDDFEDQKSVVSALCCILHQLFKQKRELLSEAILEQFEIYREEITGSFGKLWNALLSVAEDKNAGEIVCLLDAIDECEDHGRSQLAQALQTLYSTGRSCNLKFLLSSRPYVNIRHGFQPPDIPEMAVIHMSGESDVEMIKISQEIDIFIQARVSVVGEKLKLRYDEQDLLLRELMRVPNRTYLWVHLTLDLIEHDLDLDKTGIVRITSHLPNTVEEAYERILSRSRNLEEAKKLLHIVVAAARPLTLNEMNLALTLASHHQSYGDHSLKSEERFREKVRDLCGLFVTVINSRIYLLHQTAKEFLVQTNPANISKGIYINPKWKHSLWPQESHRLLVEICIWHLLSAEFEDQPPTGKGMISQYTDNQVFLDYSATHWTTHLRESRIEVNKSLNQLLLKLCDATSNRCLTWLMIYWRSTNTDFPRNFTTLMIASYFGLTTVLKPLLKLDSTDVNSKDGTYERSALSWAAGNGYHVAVKLLIKGIRSRWKGIKLPFRMGAQVDSVDRYGLTSLSYAVLNGHIAAVELLLEAGARVDTRDSIGGTPLSYAVCDGHEYMVNLLLKRGTNVESDGDMSVALLLSAAEKGHEDIIKLLLDRGRVDPNSKDRDGGTPLLLAVKNNHKPVIRLLLENQGDEAKVTDEVVKAAAGNRNDKEVMTLLLNHRGDQITITDEVVEAAVGNCNGKEVMELLLNQSGDQIIITEDAVLTIAANFDKEVMILLLNQREDQITITEEVVKAATRNWNGKEVMALLLDQRGDQINITEEVIKAAARNNKEVMALLLNQRGDQITITEEVVKIAAGNSKEVMELLLDQRGDQITITEEVVKVAASNPWNGKDVMALLLNQRGDQITITEEVVKAAAGNNNEVMELLLDQRGDQITITEEVIKAAARNWNGKEVMALLLNQRGDQIAITEEVIKAAAGNWNGKEVMALLLNQREK